MPATYYKTATSVSVTYPTLLTPDTGLHHVNDSRWRVWYHQDGRKRYLRLPAGITIEEARLRRDAIYEELQRQGAEPRTPKPPNPRLISRPVSPSITRVPEHFVIYFRGKYVGTGKTREIAEQKLAAWLEVNS